MKKVLQAFLLAMTVPLLASAQAKTRPAVLKLSFDKTIGPMDIDHIALGQGGLSPDPIWHERVPEVRALHPRIIRLFVQEYFNLLPEPKHYHFETLDKSVDDIVRAGALPLMNIDFKPKVLFPVVDQDVVDPQNYQLWEELIAHLVTHYKERGLTGLYWEVGNEVDMGETGGTPYRFRPDNYGPYYKHTIDAVLRADPQAHVGGPALANWKSPILPAFIAYCAKNHVRVDFISWHIYNSNPMAIENTIKQVKALLAPYPSLHPETILDEWNMALTVPPKDPRIQPAFITETAWRMKEQGLSYSCYYHIRDYHVERSDFAPFFSPKGASGMAFWWNVMPQYDGLFDYQNVVRPAYFAFKFMSRLTGDRLAVESDNPAVHAFLTYDASYGTYGLLFWNYSATPIDVSLDPSGLTTTLVAKRRMLDAETPSSDENARLRPLPDMTLKPETPVKVPLGPYGMEFWSLQQNRH